MSESRILVSHWGGNQNVRALLAELRRADLLGLYATGIGFSAEDSRWLNRLPVSLRVEAARRGYDVPSALLWRRPVRELVRTVAVRSGRARWRQGQGLASVDASLVTFDRSLARALPRLSDARSLGAVYAYEDCALETFRAADRLGLERIYDLPICHWRLARKLMEVEAERLPEWADVLGGGLDDGAAKLERKDRELESADLVVVPSEFVRDSLAAVSPAPTVLLSQFGSPLTAPAPPRRPDPARPLRVLFAGSMTQRKGLADLLAASRLLGSENFELVVMGSLHRDLAFYRRFGDFTYEGGRPHEEVLRLMRTCDVFVLPSLVEGRALVMQEAMSQGLPVILTPNTGGTDLVITGETGFMVDIRSPEQIAERISWFAQDRVRTAAMGLRAAEHAATYTWKDYGHSIVSEVRARLEG